MNRFDRSFARAQYAWDNMSPPEYDEDQDRDECGGFDGGCEGCDECSEETTSSKLVLARKARGNILPGDLVCVTTGFAFQPGGPRLGYLRRRETIAGYGPGHGPEQMGKGNWSSRGGFRAVHPNHADIVEAREAVAKAEAEADRVRAAEYNRLAKEAREAEQAVAKAERSAVFAAKDGDEVAYQGRTWTVGAWYTKTVYHSGMEYNGELCDATCYSQRRLTDTETNKTREFRA